MLNLTFQENPEGKSPIWLLMSAIYLFHASHGKHLENGRPMHHHHSIHLFKVDLPDFLFHCHLCQEATSLRFLLVQGETMDVLLFVLLLQKCHWAQNEVLLCLYIVLFCIFCSLILFIYIFLKISISSLCTVHISQSLDFVAQTPAQ